jgi:hypothetical protein
MCRINEENPSIRTQQFPSMVENERALETRTIWLQVIVGTRGSEDLDWTCFELRSGYDVNYC